MENQAIDDDVRSEEICESFTCCICLDLLYKPIVLSCGHISCFWCVHKSMNAIRVSNCPTCRHPYNHFPTICWMLHLLILKMYPIAYKRRENQILEEEIKMDCFSPQFDAQACGSQCYQKLDHLGNTASCSTIVFESNSSSDPWSTGKGEPCANLELAESDSHVQDDGTSAPVEIYDGNSEVVRNVAVEQQNCKRVSAADVLCSACMQLLFRPVVLNCGHVYCESCIINPADKMIECQVCQSLHPRGFPKVCLELHHFLEEQFPIEYALRRNAVQLKQVDVNHKGPTTCSPEASQQGENLPWSDLQSEVHIGAGCDSCGMCPIIGDRYKCEDCVEQIGFDLCGDCYNTRSKLPGRFNQQHTSEHKFELVRFSYNMLRLVTAPQFEDGSTAILIDVDDALQDSEDESPAPTLSGDAQENAESDSAAPVPSADGVEDQNNTQSAT